VVIENDFDDLIVTQNKGIGKLSIHRRVCCVFSGRHDRIESWNLLLNITDILEKGTLGSQ